MNGLQEKKECDKKMNEEKVLKKNLLKNILINLCIFVLLFLIFDVIIYRQVSISLYNSVDRDLLQEVSRYEGKNYIENKDKKKFMNPRVTWIKRDLNGNILNTDALGRIYEKFGNEIKFDSNQLNEVYSLNLEDQYNYRAINFKIVNEEGQEQYVQLLANVDGEEQTLRNLFNILILGTAILITISIIVSYVLSKRMMSHTYKAYKKQTEFVENASHELRTPLAIIQAKQELLLQEPESKIIDKSEDINLTLKETKRLSKMIKELMQLARSDSNEYKLNKEMVNIDSLIKDVVVPYQDLAEIENKKIELDLKFGKEINVDKNKITELLIILLDNALKYTTENDTITIKTYAKEGKCNIEVRDTGIGISDEGLKQIFNRFYREDKARSRETGGTGLGLSIAHTIVTNHKGSIKAMHNEPKGTIFIIKL